MLLDPLKYENTTKRQPKGSAEEKPKRRVLLLFDKFFAFWYSVTTYPKSRELSKKSPNKGNFSQMGHDSHGVTK
jgi:hypothetical protein